MMRARLSVHKTKIGEGTKPIDPLREIGRECERGPLEQKNVIYTGCECERGPLEQKNVMYTGCVSIRTSGGENPNLDQMKSRNPGKSTFGRNSITFSQLCQ